MYNQDGDASEPEWVKTEREQFTEFRDKNKDGKMDKEETRDWILPSDYDHAEAEAKHLVYESDADKVSIVIFLQKRVFPSCFVAEYRGKWNVGECVTDKVFVDILLLQK